ncbi:phage tail protein [Burkholderia pseudomallei]
MAGNLIQITDAGRAALVAAGNTGTVAHQVVEIGLGTAPFAFDKGMTALPSEHKRVKTFGGENVAPDTVHVVIQDDSTDEYSLHAFGLYLENGVLFGVYVQDTSILEKSPAAMLLLASDIVFASIDAAQLQFGPATFLNPPATTERKGVIELATQAEVDAGKDDTRSVTPRGAAARYAALTGAIFTGPIETSGSLTARGTDAGGANFRAVSGDYGTFLRNDGTTAALLSTLKGDPTGPSAGSMPFAWTLASGQVTIDGTGSGATLGGPVTINGKVSTNSGADFAAGVTVRGVDAGGANLRAIGGDYGALMLNDGTSVYLLSTKKGDSFGAANSYRPFTWSLSTGRVLVGGGGAVTEFGGEIVVPVDISVGRNATEGHIRIGPANGYFYGNERSVGFWSETIGRFQYVFADRTFRVNDKVVFHEGNLDPLDKTKGGTMAADLAFAPDKRIALADGSRSSPSLTFASDGDTGIYHMGDGGFDIACNGQAVLRFTPSIAAFDQAVTGPTPPTGDRSTRLATTEWVLAAQSAASIGQVVFEIRSTVRAGFLKANGAVVSRADYPALWAYAQASGALVSDADWGNRRWGCFGMGDGSTTFRLPELRGEFLRCWDDTRGIDSNRQIGSQQDTANLWHSHGASASASGDHNHSAWTDAQGNHNHHGWTGGGGEHQHVVPFGQHQNSFNPPWGTDGDNNRFGAKEEDWDNKWFLTSPSGGHSHEFYTEGNGNHGHNVGIGVGGNHSHGITVNADGANEARPRNVALLAMIRAY